MNKLYLAGDCLYRGSILLREEEKQKLKAIGIEPYVPQDDKEINDKQNQTEDSNNGLAEKIVLKDTKAIKESDTIIINTERFAEGTLVELGQIKAYNEINDIIMDLISEKDLTDSMKVSLIKSYFNTYNPKKTVYATAQDIRRTDISECGDRRSFYINQYVYGTVLEVTKGRGFMEFDDIVEELKNKGK